MGIGGKSRGGEGDGKIGGKIDGGGVGKTGGKIDGGVGKIGGKMEGGGCKGLGITGG